MSSIEQLQKFRLIAANEGDEAAVAQIDNDIMELQYQQNMATGERPNYQQQFERTPEEKDAALKEQASRTDMQTMGGLMQMIRMPTFELGDEAVAKIVSPFLAAQTGQDTDTSYQQALDLIRASMESYAEENPKASTGLYLSGAAPSIALSTMLPGSQAIEKGITSGGFVQRATIGGAAGGGVGALEGFGSSEVDGVGISGRLPDTAKGFGIGMAIGTTLTPLGGELFERALIPIGTWGVKKSKQIHEAIMDKVAGNLPFQVTDETGQLTPDAMYAYREMIEKSENPQQIEREIKQTLIDENVLQPEELDNLQLFDKYGMPKLRGQLTQRTDDWVEIQDAAKYSGDVSQVIADQDKILTRLVKNQSEALQPTTLEHQETNDFIYNIALNTVQKYDDAVSEAYNAAREIAKGKTIAIPMSNSVKKISELKDEEGITGGLISAVKGKMKELELLDKNGSPIAFQGISKEGGLEKVYPKLTLNQAENMRIYLNSLYESATPRGRQLIRDLKDSIDEDVAATVGEDVFLPAREAKINMMKVLENQKRSKYDVVGKSFIEKIINGKVKQGDILNQMLRLDKVDMGKTKKFFLEDAGEEGVQAWQNIKAQIVRDALDKALGTQGKGEAGVKVFNARLFANEVKKMQRKGLLNQVFDETEIDFLNDIIRMGELRVPVSRVQMGSGATGKAVQELGSGVEALRNIMMDSVDPTGIRWFGRIFKTVKQTKADRKIQKEGVNKAERQLNPQKETEQAIKDYVKSQRKQ